MMETALMALIGAGWRIVDGVGIGRTHLRSAVLLAIILTFMQSKVSILTLDAWPMWLWAVATIAALQRGFEDWNKFDLRQTTQYYYSLIPVPILVFTGYLNYEGALMYVACTLLAGLAHPLLVRTSLPHQTRWAEGVAGALILGGMAGAMTV